MTTVVLTVFLAAGIIVSIINVATILSGNGWRRPRWMRSEPAAHARSNARSGRRGGQGTRVGGGHRATCAVRAT